MSLSPYESTNLSWKLQKLSQQLTEWIEVQLEKIFPKRPSFPKIDVPDMSPLWTGIGIIILGLIVILMLWGIKSIFKKIQQYIQSHNTSSSLTNSVGEKEITLEEWLKRSQNFQRQGDYYQACRCLYLAMLEHLHQQQLIPQQPSRTDEEYCYYILSHFPYPSPYETLLKIHQKLSFSQQEATLSDFHSCQQAYQEILKLS